MPHKHRLKGTDASSHELPPSSIAEPLPVSKTPRAQNSHKAPKRKNDPKDDTPRAFTRLMNYTSTGHKTPRGLDDGIKLSANKKRKRGSNDEEQAAQNVAHTSGTTKADIPKILPGERMGDFSARVDQALPVVGLASKGKGVGGLKERQTKTERKMQRMQKEWREMDVRRKAKLQEAEEEAEEEEEEDGGGGGGGGGGGRVTVNATGSGKGKKKGKRRRNKGGDGKEGSNDDGGDDEDDEDPWAVVAANRRREHEEKEKGEGKGGLVGLHDVVLAPPKFTKVPTKVDVADVVRKGGLKRQVELSEARASVIEGYRRMMRERREGTAIGTA
ncbi:MAG: hypothetical protein L6R42_006751 [Xanthoria sp. 1 TBL-2021]|nr:MAG: hypothetical protein L6R42_006751 [Xanthoria sp. 1 TBL-2021]